MPSLIEALDRLREAIAQDAKERAIRPLEGRLARLMRRMFRQQKAYLLKRAKAGLEGELLGSIERAAFSAAMASIEARVAEVLLVAFERGQAAAERDLREALAADVLRERMAKRAAELIGGIDEVTREKVHALLVAAVEQKWSYTKLAGLLRKLFAGFATPASQRHIRDRAELIAFTEIGQAFVDGQYEAAEELERGGAVLEKGWLTVGDEHVSDGCLKNEQAGWIPLAQTFPSGHRAPLRFPGCRCALQTRRKATE